MAEDRLHVVDYVVFGATLVISLGIGVYHALSGGRQRTTNEFLLGNRRLSTVPVALSMFMSYASAISVIGMSAEVYQFGTQVLAGTFFSFLSVIFSVNVFTPLMYRLKLVSSFEYYELRFESRVLRRCLSVISILQMTFLTGIVMFAPSTAFEAVSGLPVWIAIVCTGIAATIYTTIGGIKAVVWTDAFQALVFFGGIITVLIVGAVRIGGLSEVWRVSDEGGRIIFFNGLTFFIITTDSIMAESKDEAYSSLLRSHNIVWNTLLNNRPCMSLDPHERVTFWNVVVGGMISQFAQSTINQNNVQRLSALPSLRAAKLSAVFLWPVGILYMWLLCLLGLVIYAYYAVEGCDPIMGGQIRSGNQLVPLFLVDVLGYPGVTGLFIAVLFSGALSSVSSTMSSVSAVVWRDLLEWKFTGCKEDFKAFITKAIVLIFGAVSIGMAFLVQILPGHVMQISNAVIGGMSGCTAGILLLGMFFPWANWKGAVTGLVSGLTLVMWMNVGQLMSDPFRETLPTIITNCSLTANTTLLPPPQTPEGIFPLYAVSFNWFPMIAAGTAMGVGLVVSFITGPQDPSSLNPDVVAPVCDQLCCCLPRSLRRWLWCGVGRDEDLIPRDKKDKNIDKGEKNSFTNVGDHSTEQQHEHHTSNRIAEKILCEVTDSTRHITDQSNLDKTAFILNTTQIRDTITRKTTQEHNDIFITSM